MDGLMDGLVCTVLLDVVQPVKEDIECISGKTMWTAVSPTLEQFEWSHSYKRNTNIGY